MAIRRLSWLLRKIITVAKVRNEDEKELQVEGALQEPRTTRAMRARYGRAQHVAARAEAAMSGGQRDWLQQRQAVQKR